MCKQKADFAWRFTAAAGERCPIHKEQRPKVTQSRGRGAGQKEVQGAMAARLAVMQCEAAPVRARISAAVSTA